MDINNPADILRRHFNGLASEEEKEWLSSYLAGDKNKDIILAVMQETWFEYAGTSEVFQPGVKDKILETILRNKELRVVGEPQPKRIIFLFKTSWLKYAAAIILFLSVITAYYFLNKNQSPDKITATKSLSPGAGVFPGSDKAILTLSNGQQILLDSTAAETINDSGLSIQNNQGELLYKNSEFTASNTMSTPKGGQYKLTLADGTKVWLNAASSITYPTAFTKKTREVKVTGEVYFEVAKNKTKPFIVKTAGEEIIVLGTAFNINAYEDEPASKISLAEGTIKINNTILKPGQAYKNGKISSTNINQDLAWKNGYFNLSGVNLHELMRQLERWYDIEVEYRGEIPSVEFTGEINREVNLSDVIKFLSDNDIKLKLEGRTLIVGD